MFKSLVDGVCACVRQSVIHFVCEKILFMFVLGNLCGMCD